MSVFVDKPIHPFGRMKMCHMLADTHDELLAMADKIGVNRKWIQHEGTPREHFDVCKSKRDLAIKHGAIEVTMRDIAMKIRSKVEAAPTDKRGEP